MSKATSPWKLILSTIVAFGILVTFKRYFLIFLKLMGFNVAHVFIESILFVVISAAFVRAFVGIFFAFLVGRSILPQERSWFLWPYGILTTSLYILWVLSNYFTNTLTIFIVIDFLIKIPIYSFFAYLFLSEKVFNVLVQRRT